MWGVMSNLGCIVSCVSLDKVLIKKLKIYLCVLSLEFLFPLYKCIWSVCFRYMPLPKKGIHYEESRAEKVMLLPF